ncbi:methionine aminopeptidase, type II [Caldisphaera lagunensis DSM 15908]|uniref:Methionine aminopeptidase n=1 Tax=Caldisphaera lagunensis (strain DSM 15908 / JCM 11604 / ANMR 0165 / IC-154) TaxID=1056495 RepID=L0AD57_CALLD|nr:type II methionyl aminopeptidase [Caldisphaera lagunensis]AFZ71072.1 methionine aminopeptidase, type II [Caldisphaera lagunensis DSM 15908]
MFSNEEIEKLIKAGKIGAEARDLGASLVKPGASSREICDEVENYIIKKGADIAFPCNLSINEIAAHYTPGIEDDMKIPSMGIIKIDVGASIDGYLSDTATSVIIGDQFKELAMSVKKALENVINIMKPNISIYDIGKTIEMSIKSQGFRPIKNLTGHTISRYNLHAGESIPNYPDRTMFYKRLRPGTQVAIEPFGTFGKGFVIDGPKAFIYSLTGRKPKNISEDAKQLLEYIEKKYNALPFAARWLIKEFEKSKVEDLLNELTMQKALVDYPILIEAGRGIVAQYEHTFLILNDRVIVTTL